MESSVTPAKKRKYTGPAKGSQEAKDMMKKVRAAQWAKNGLSANSEDQQCGDRVNVDVAGQSANFACS